MALQEVPPRQLPDVLAMSQPDAVTVSPEAARPASRRARRRVVGLFLAIAVAAGAIIFLAVVVAPWASAAGGCGGG